MNKYELKNNIIIKSMEIILNIILLLKLQNNLLSITTVFIINILFAQLITSLLEVISFIPINRYKKRLVNKVDEFLNIENDIEETNYINKLDITIKDLSFSYNSLNNTIKNINLNFKKGEKYLIQSKNGTGKSTIFKLLTKELTKYEGSIMIGNEELKDISYKEISRKISFISQDETIFPGTIKDNILLGLDVHHKTLNKIIKLCDLDELINKKPFGLDTFLYGGGEELSGGEKQLIILARFLIRNKSILIIDEATSEISQELEDKVLNNILRYYKDKTILFVSHKNKDYLFKNIIKIK